MQTKDNAPLCFNDVSFVGGGLASLFVIDIPTKGECGWMFGALSVSGRRLSRWLRLREG